MRWGDILLVVSPGDYGKPRPAVVVQRSDLNDAASSVLVCLITSDRTDAPDLRIDVAPSSANGLRASSQIMVEKLVALRRDRLRERIGCLTPEQGRRLAQRLRWLTDPDPTD